MTFNESIKHCLKNYFTTKGRATRSEYWWFQLFWCMTLTIECIVLNITSEIAEGLSFFLAIIEFLITFALLIPNICVCVRRLHDTGWSGNTLLWCLCGFALPFIHGCIQSLNPMLNETNREITAGSFAGSFILGIFIGLIIVNIRNLFKSDADNIYGPKTMPQKKQTTVTATNNNDNQITPVTAEGNKIEAPEETNETKVNYCRFCGRPTTPGAMFCNHCGKPLDKKAEREPLSKIAGTINKLKTKMQNINKKKSKRTIKIISSITIVLAIIYGGIKAYPDIVAMKTYSDIKQSFNASTGDDKLLIAWRLCDPYELWSQEYKNVNDSILEEKLSKEYKSSDTGLRNNALKFITDEAKNGNAYAQYILGWLYKYNSCIPNDLVKAAYWTYEAAKQNYPEAFGEMATNYLYGYGVKRNIRKTVIFAIKGTELNDSQSQYALGCLYRDGIYAETGTNWEVKYNNTFGGGYYQCTRQYENDSIIINYNYEAKVYDIDTIIPYDINKAKALWRKAAQQGNSYAQKSLEKVYD